MKLLRVRRFSQRGFDPSGLHPYPDRLRCQWRLVAPPGYVIFVKSVVMDMDMSCAGHVDLIDGVANQRLRRWCGRDPQALRSTGNVLIVDFVGRRWAVGISQSRGVKLYFEHVLPPVECGGDQRRCRHGTKCFPRSQMCDGIDHCGDGTDEEGCPPTTGQLAMSYVDRCGRPAVEPRLLPLAFRIVGGTRARPGSWPWMVSLRLRRKEPNGHLCGGVVVSSG